MCKDKKIEEILKQIKEVALKRFVGVSHSVMHSTISEEVGEVATCVKYENGLKTKKPKEDYLNEVADVIRYGMYAFFADGGTVQDLFELIDIKNKKKV